MWDGGSRRGGVPPDHPDPQHNLYRHPTGAQARPGSRGRAFSLEDDGRLVVTPVTGSVVDLAGLLPRPAVPLTQEETDEAVTQAVVRRAVRR